jgi:DNA-binding CsgD family transcriptional regulator
MPAKEFKTDFDDLRAFVLNLYNEEHSKLKPVIPEEKQLREIDLLKETIGGRRFFFAIDMVNFKMMHCHGVQKWLGYAEKEFTLKKYWDSVVHPGAKKSLLLVVKKMYEMLSSGHFRLEFMVQRFSTKLPVKARDGQYLLTLKTSSIFQYDENNRLLAYLDEFTIIGNYNDEPGTEPAIYNTKGEIETAKETEILKKVQEQFQRMNVYSLSELQIARKLAYSSGVTQPELAKQFECSVHTVKTLYKRFLLKTREFFHKTEDEIPTTLDAVMFLKKEGLL